MGLDKPDANLVFHAKDGSFDTHGKKIGHNRVREKDRRAYILPDSVAFPATEPRIYYGNGNGQPVSFHVAQYAEDIRRLSALKFL